MLHFWDLAPAIAGDLPNDNQDIINHFLYSNHSFWHIWANDAVISCKKRKGKFKVLYFQSFVLY